MEEKSLYKFLCLPLYNDLFKKRYNGNAIIEEIKRNPNSAAKKYGFRLDAGDYEPYVCYPLHQAIRLRANIDVVKALHYSYPPAVKAKCEEREVGSTALHLAAKYYASIEVVLFLFDLWPEAIKEVDSYGFMPLHWACCKATNDQLDVAKFLLNKFSLAVRVRYNQGKSALQLSLMHNAPVELTSLLLKCWPEATREKDNFGISPLHTAISNKNGTFENVSLILNYYPDAVRGIHHRFGRTPLYTACLARAPLKVFLLLLEMWPEASLVTDNDGMTPQEISKRFSCSEDAQKALFHVSQLCRNTVDSVASKEIMYFFIEIEWWKGVLLILDQYPTFAKVLEIETNVLPSSWSTVGRCCRLKTLWSIIRNELDIIESI